MSSWSAIIDPIEEDAANTPVELVGTAQTDTIFLLSLELPTPDVEPTIATSPDTEGDYYTRNRYKNRKITAHVRVVGSTPAEFQSAIGTLQVAIGKIHSQNGTFRITPPDGSAAITFDLIDAQILIPTGRDTSKQRADDVTITFDAMPLGREDEVLSAVTSEATLPVVTAELADVGGDSPALGRIIVTEADGASQRRVIWGIRELPADADNAAIYYEAESRELGTGPGISSTSPVDATTDWNPAAQDGSVGSGDLVYANTLLDRVLLFTTNDGVTGDAHAHVGIYRMWARIGNPNSSAANQPSVWLEWSVGDQRQVVVNDAAPVDIGRSWSMQIVDLGIVVIPPGVDGAAQRWIGNVYAADYSVMVDSYWLQPLHECSGVVEASDLPPAGDAIALDWGFLSSAGNLNGKATGEGGAWVTSGDATDIVQGAHACTRSVASDAGTGRIALTAEPNDKVVVEIYHTYTGGSAGYHQVGLYARYDDANNHVQAVIDIDPANDELRVGVTVRVAGTTVLDGTTVYTQYSIDDDYDGNGRWALHVAAGAYAVTLDGVVLHSGIRKELSEDGTLPDGANIGFRDNGKSGSNAARAYQEFSARPTDGDAAVFASQSLEIRNNVVQRERADGSALVPVSDYEGDYCLIPPAGPKGRSTEVMVKASRGKLIEGDPAIDDISVQVGVTARWLVLPFSP